METGQLPRSELPRLIQPEIECLLANAPLAKKAGPKEACEASLARVRSAVLAAAERDRALEAQDGGGAAGAKDGGALALTIEHTLTPLFICIRGNHYAAIQGDDVVSSISRLEETALSILDVTVSACGPSVFATRMRAFWEILGRCVAVMGTASGQYNTETSEESKLSCLRVCAVLLQSSSSLNSFWTEQAPALVPVAIETAVAYLYEANDGDAKDEEDAETKHANQIYEKYVEDEDGLLSQGRVALFARTLVNDICASLPLELWQRMQEHFRAVIMSLPRIARTKDEAHLVAGLNTAAGYAEILGSRLRPLFDAHTSSKRLLHSLCQCLEISPVAIVGQQRNKLSVTRVSSQKTSGDLLDEVQFTTSSYYDIPFFHVRSANCRDALARLISTISRLTDGRALLEMLTNPNASDWRVKKYCVQCAYIANAVFRDAYSHITDQMNLENFSTRQRVAGLFAEIRMLCRRTTESEQWCLHTSHDSYTHINAHGGGRDAVTLGHAQYNTNAILVALHVQRLGDAAEISQMLGLDFRRLLLSVAYPLLEKLGDANPVVSQAAQATLRRVAIHCGYAKPGESARDALSNLLRDNIDYLVDAVCARLSIPEQNPGTAAVIRGIFHRSNRSLVGNDESTTALLTEVVSTLLLALDREFQLPDNKGVYNLLQVCKEIVVSLRGSISPELDWISLDSALTWSQERQNEIRKARHTESEHDFEDAFIGLAADIKEWQNQVSQLLIDPDGSDTEASEEIKNEVDDSSLTNTDLVTQSVKEIIMRCCHFLSSQSSLHIQMCCLEAMDGGIRIMAANEQELLPVVAKVWPSIRAEARSASIPVAISGIRSVVTISIVCGEFIQSRFAKELWPSLQRLLKSQTILAARRRRSLVTSTDIQRIAAGKENGDGSRSRQEKLAEEISVASELLDQLMAVDGDTTWWCVASNIGLQLKVPEGGRHFVNQGLVKSVVVL
eukprot:g3574.t1